MRKQFWIYGCVVTFILSGLSSAGCSRTVKVENMKPVQFNVSNHHQYSVHVKVTGQMGLSSARGKKDDIDHERLSAVIQQSIVDSKLFSGLASEQEADFLLEIIVFKSNIVGTPTATITTVVPMNWVLMSRKPRQSVFQTRTENQVSVKAKNQFGSANRYSSANELSVNKSIQQGIHEISLLDL